MNLSTQHIPLQPLQAAWLGNISADVLRLDKIHPIVSGNKWFKLQHYLAEAKALGKDTIATFGGAYSNHIAATAFACAAAGLNSVGIIRGETPTQLSHTLTEAKALGMQLIFVSREAYKNKTILEQQYEQEQWHWVGEGGYGTTGMLGAADILQVADTHSYTHIIASCGTGTTLAGIIYAAKPQQQVIGISALKGHTGLEEDIQQLLPPEKQKHPFNILHDYHFGGYAKHPPALIEWMKELWQETQLPTDIVYTGKLLYAVKDLCEKSFFTPAGKLLVIHSGGLQGNASLPLNTLPF